jgi:hypothetical protein
MSKPASPAPDEVMRVHVPFSIRKRGSRKLVVVPAGAPVAPDRPRVDNAMVKALARAFRWRKLLETGVYGAIEELAAAEKINASYVSRVLRLTLLAPHIVEQILRGQHQPLMTLATILKPLPSVWHQQVAALGVGSAASSQQHPVGLEDNGQLQKEQTT